MIVVGYRRVFLRKMAGLGFLDSSNAPAEEAKKALPDDLECPRQAILDKTVVFFHDKSNFQCTDDQPTFGGSKDMCVLRPKSKGAGIMVSDFTCEQHGYPALTAEQYEAAGVSDPTIKMQAGQFLEYGEAK